MKIAIISDIHGNYDALEAIIKYLEKKKIKKIICLGDYVNYYYDAEKCINLLIKKKATCIKGNHDDILIKYFKNKKKLNFLASKYGNSIYRNLDNLKKKHINYLKSLPKRLIVKINKKKILIAHGAPWKSDFYFYKNVKSKWKKKIKKYNKDIFIFGHTHYPMKIILDDKKIILNPGSVGQPRNNSKKACWLLLNVETMNFKFMQTSYDKKKLINQIKKYDPNNKRLLKYFL